MPDRVHHQLTVKGRAGSVDLDVSLALTAPWTILFGPSGSGKSSLLRAAAGVLPALDVTFTRSNEALHARPTHLRQLAYAPQQAALFPHLSVRDNITFPLTIRDDRKQHETLAAQAIDLFRLRSLLDARPQELSGGEQRRVALARALTVPHAKLLMLDEPFTGFDRKLRDDLIPALQQWTRERNLPVLSVTHDVDEALLLNAEVIRLHGGCVTAHGPALEVLADERERLLANLQK
ncbi:ATP-binding cassette domain-containing protein [Granulicella cerasi]|uniref:ATP-binding cassette domain-containing protein n=1 Tax=Granulicella cerasi TaxID=741063 RepID=A0ABW1ZFM1_9BACT|nr:ATP-binding cassette domain-containing protein [Granulicella cerasi]